MADDERVVVTITRDDLKASGLWQEPPAAPDVTDGGRWSPHPGPTTADSPRQCMSHASQWRHAKRKRRRRKR